MNQQTVLESKRILAIIDDALEDLMLLQHLPVSPSKPSPLPPPSGLDHFLAELFEAEQRLEAAPPLNSEELNFIHKNAVRAVLDFLRRTGQMNAPSSISDEGLARFQVVMKTLRSLMNDKFNTTVEEDLLKFEILRDTVSREQTASADVKALNREFQSERSLRKVEVARRDQAIAKLTEELQMIQNGAVEDAKAFERQVKAQEEAAAQTYKEEEEQLLSSLEQLETNLRRAEEANHKEEAALRQERRKREQFLDGLLTQYDTEMTDKTRELGQFASDIANDHLRLEQLEKDLKMFDEQQAKRDDEERVENHRKMHHMNIITRIETSSKLLQAFWRGFAVRNMLKKKKSGKKKKKK